MWVSSNELSYNLFVFENVDHVDTHGKQTGPP